MENNYYQVQDNKHYYSDLDQLIHTFEQIDEYGLIVDAGYILTGLKNTKMNGYELKFNPNFNPDGNHHETGEKEL